MPVHHLLEHILDEYIVAAGLQSGQPLFQSVNSLGTAVTGRALNRYNAWAAIRKQAKAAGTFPWEFVQLGNCGSPIETDAGWLVADLGPLAFAKVTVQSTSTGKRVFEKLTSVLKER